MRIRLTLAIAAAVAVPTGIVAETPTTDIAPLLASTFFGGGDEESTVDVALGPDGSIYILGFTLSADLPTTPGAFDRTYNPPGPDEFGGDPFVARLDAGANTLIYSTYLGGTDTDYPRALAVGPGGEVYVLGWTYSDDFPTTPGAFSPGFNGGCCDAFVTALDPTGGALLWSTFVGGNGLDTGYQLAVAESGEVVLTGETLSPDFPTTPGAWDRVLNNGAEGYQDAFVARLDANGSELVWSTYLGGTYSDYGQAVALRTDGRVYAAGHTMASDFPTTPGAFDRTFAGGGVGDAYVTAFDAGGGSLAYSTFLGGFENDEIWSLALDATGSAYLTGYTGSADFPTTPDAFDRVCERCFISDAFVSRLDPTGSALLYSTFLGGGDTDFGLEVTVPEREVVLVTGTTYSPGFPTTPEAPDRALGGSADIFLTKLRLGQSALVYSTFLGGDGFIVDTGAAVAPDWDGTAVVTGDTHSADFPVTLGAYDTSYNGDFDAVASRLEIPERASLHVAAVEARYRPAGPGFVVAAAIAVRDAWSHPISGARVGVELALPDGGAVALAATTDARGVARVGRAVRSPGTYSFTVIDVRAEAWVYAPHQDLETGDRVTIP